MTKYKVEITVDATDAQEAVSAASSLLTLAEDIDAPGGVASITLSLDGGNTIAVYKHPLASGGYTGVRAGASAWTVPGRSSYIMWNGVGPLPTKPPSHAPELQVKQAGGDLPEPGRVHARPDIAFVDRPEV